MTPKPTIDELEENKPIYTTEPRETGDVWAAFEELEAELERLASSLSIYLTRTECVRGGGSRESTEQSDRAVEDDYSLLEKRIYDNCQKAYEIRLGIEQCLIELRV